MSKFNRNPGNSPVFGKGERGVLKEPLVCPVNCMQGLESFDHVDSKDEKTRNVTLQSTNLAQMTLCVSGFIWQSMVNWPLDIGRFPWTKPIVTKLLL